MSIIIIGQIVLFVNRTYCTKLLKIKDLREDNDLTQAQIAELLMCDQSLYSKYERGEREIPLRLLIILSDYYNVSLDYIVGRTNKKEVNI